MPEKQVLLNVKQLTKWFPGVFALNKVDLEVVQGEIHGLIGENGAGKSTLVKILSGIYPIGEYEGSFFLSGEQLKLDSPNEALKKGIGIVPQEINVIG